ncbi:DUF2333 family protein [Photobacterium angustum]|uniref:DUF2333 family protein n=1 Tax=Photobacterium angustum TaxID=661 RepID=UPI0005DC78C0|nr:DUF2333 family protein [Photobacterium angustum]KJG00908.1 hypothetical protein UB35_16020 [Photobacterium angustum]KJG16200.1 hypothetical protein UA33_15945 [Photobacterium angustum]KJG22281.1 hypothetical protein UA39_15260 [Photobacterium angustum]KJG28659.1 hypothetical protein UA36_17325 [Photobacterium angustum]PSV67476.1 DUF2333 domain-containing protein [Photobacterium angustum]
MSKVKVIIGAVFFTCILYFLSVYWSFEPDTFNPDSYAAEQAKLNHQTLTTGYETTTTLIHISELLINKSGGFLTNDKLPPSLLMDNMPAWETGVLTQVRDMALVLKDNLSRPQNESHIDSDLKEAQPALNINSHSWNFPSAESEYQNAIDALTRYRDRLSTSRHPAQFYSRDDNLVAWLEVVQKRLGTISQDLGSSVGEPQLIMDREAEGKEVSLNAPKTSWFKIDNVFYESRGSTWAILLLMKAMKHDFKPLLEEEKATVMIDQIIRELEATQETVWSPMILNGMGFGLLPNHSLIMANYVSRAQAGTVDLINLLEKR